MNGLIGYALTDTKTLATFGATTYVLAPRWRTMPASLWMGRVGRRRGFMTGAAINIALRRGRGRPLAAELPLFCVATAIIGVYNAIGLQYRFAAAEVAAPAFRAKAISLRAGGRHPGRG